MSGRPEYKYCGPVDHSKHTDPVQTLLGCIQEDVRRLYPNARIITITGAHPSPEGYTFDVELLIPKKS